MSRGDVNCFDVYIVYHSALRDIIMIDYLNIETVLAVFSDFSTLIGLYCTHNTRTNRIWKKTQSAPWLCSSTIATGTSLSCSLSVGKTFVISKHPVNKVLDLYPENIRRIKINNMTTKVNTTIRIYFLIPSHCFVHGYHNRKISKLV